MQSKSNDQLCALAQKGDHVALDLLLENNFGFIRKTANELYRSMNLSESSLCLDQDDLVQEGSIGLLNAIPHFDDDCDIKFLTYAAPAIRNGMIDFVRAEISQFEIKISEKDGLGFRSSVWRTYSAKKCKCSASDGKPCKTNRKRGNGSSAFTIAIVVLVRVAAAGREFVYSSVPMMI